MSAPNILSLDAPATTDPSELGPYIDAGLPVHKIPARSKGPTERWRHVRQDPAAVRKHLADGGNAGARLDHHLALIRH